MIMVNTDLHSKQLKSKMTKKHFVSNLRGIGLDGLGKDEHESYCNALWEDISQNEIRIFPLCRLQEQLTAYKQKEKSREKSVCIVS